MNIATYRFAVMTGILGMLAFSSTAQAQYKPRAEGPPAENYHIEGSFSWWDPTPELNISSESFGIPGDDINLIDDLGIGKNKIGQFNIVLRPGKKHRFRYQYLPISYSADAVLSRQFVFNGQRYTIGLPVKTSASFKTSRFGYEYDAGYFKRGFVGVLFDLKYTNVDVELASPLTAQPEFTNATAPIPTIGVVGRGYLTDQLAVNGEVSLLRVPESLRDSFDGSYTDADFNATYNFNRYVGATLGLRRLSVFYSLDNDTGTLKFNGWYFGGVVRY